jgi:thiamine-phosphate pyrophosphorylase
VTSLTVITDRRRSRLPLPELCRAAAQAGADFIQVREKDLEGKALAALVRDVVAAVEGTRTQVLVNGRPDVAELAGAHGVQLPEDGLAVEDVRRFFPALVVGASRHDAGGVRDAAAAGAHLVLLGPVFETPGKEGTALGVARFADARRGVDVPVIALGGIDAGRSSEAVRAGASGVAAIRPFLDDPAAGVRALRQALA